MSRASFAALSAAELHASSTWPTTHIKTTLELSDIRPCTRQKISAIRGCGRSRFWRLCRHERESERNRNWLTVDGCIMSSDNRIPRASDEKIDELFVVHNRDATMAADLSLFILWSISENATITIILLKENVVEFWLVNSGINLWLVSK